MKQGNFKTQNFKHVQQCNIDISARCSPLFERAFVRLPNLTDFFILITAVLRSNVNLFTRGLTWIGPGHQSEPLLCEAVD